MAKVTEFLSWILMIKREFNKEEVKTEFALVEETWQSIFKTLKDNNFIEETKPGIYKITDNAYVLPNFTRDTLKPLIENYFSGRDNNNAELGRIGWDTVKNIDKFKVYPGEEKIYEIHLRGKVIKMESKEIMDYEIFILKLFETFGIMLPVYRTLKHDWAQMVSYWMQNFGETVESHNETISIGTEATEAVVSYINHSVVSDDYIVKDGLITYKNGMLYVPTKCIKKLLRREELNITLRKLAYLMKDYLISGSIPLKVENKSERFWKLYANKFELQLDKELKLEKEPDTEDDSQEPLLQSVLAPAANPVEVVKTFDPVPAPNPSPDAIRQPPQEDSDKDVDYNLAD
jgi:hypothetical protein